MAKKKIKADRKLEEAQTYAKASEDYEVYGKLAKNKEWKYFKKEIVDTIKKWKKELVRERPSPKLVGEIEEKLVIFEQESTELYLLRLARLQEAIKTLEIFIDYPQNRMRESEELINKDKEE